VTLARHVAAERDERACPEAVLLGAEQRGDDHVAALLEPAIGAQDDAIPEALPHEHLVRLGEPELPRPHPRT